MRNHIAICLAAAVAACSGPADNNAAQGNDANATASNATGNAAAANAATPSAAPAASNAMIGNTSAVGASTPPYAANGSEPGWTLNIGAGQMVYESQNGPNLTVPTPAPQTITNGLKYVTTQLTVTITHTPCQGANEHNYADTVQVDVAGQTLNGCGE